MCDLEKPVPCTDEMSCTVNKNHFSCECSKIVSYVNFKVNFDESINLIILERVQWEQMG